LLVAAATSHFRSVLASLIVLKAIMESALRQSLEWDEVFIALERGGAV